MYENDGINDREFKFRGSVSVHRLKFEAGVNTCGVVREDNTKGQS